MADIKWYYKPAFVIIALVAMGPFALPLVWRNPKFNKLTKALITFAMVLITIWLVKFSIDIYRILEKEMQSLQNLLAQ